MKRPRLTVRGLMVAVAVVGLPLWAYDAARQSRKADIYRLRALSFAKMERLCRDIDAMAPGTKARLVAEVSGYSGYLRARLTQPELTRKLASYYGAMKNKYLYAAAHPRDPVPPDPPPPE